MAWKDIIGQEHAKRLLQKAIIDNRVAHAYFIWGSEGIGKDALAIEFARVVNCNNPIISGNEIEACRVCPACKMAGKLQHPNIQLVFALPTPKSSDSKSEGAIAGLTDEQIDEIQEQIAMKAENLYHIISVTKANQIKINQIRELKRNLSLAANQHGRRCIIISKFDEMTTEASNAFLKTLEEPHENVTILITTSKSEAILPTIISRCQQIHCEPISDELLCSAVVGRLGATEAEARLITSFAQGSFTRAVEFLDENMKQLREDIIALLRTSLKKKIFRLDLMSSIEELSKEKDKKKIELILTLLIVWMRDVIALQRTGNENNIINIDQVDTIRRFGENFKNCNTEKAIEALEKAVTQVKRNVNIQLLLINLFLMIRDIFLKGGYKNS